MANKTVKFASTSVKCSVCGKEIPPSKEGGIPCDYVWRNGRNYCWDCLKEAGKIEVKRK